MKLANVRFLSKANIRKNKRGNIVRILIVLLVLSLTLISSFAITVTDAVNEYKEDFRARALEVDPWDGHLDEDTLESIRNVDHVEDIYMLEGMRDCMFDVVETDDEELSESIGSEDVYVWAWSLIGDEKRSVIAGKALDESPTFSCIIPSMFYPFENVYDEESGSNKNNLDYIDGESLIGKTITIKASADNYETLYNYYENGYGANEWVQLPVLEYKLKIVGVYYSSPTAAGYFDEIYVSSETGKLITEMALKAGGYNLDSDENIIEKWWSTPSLHTHYLIVDDFDNISYVYNELSEMGISCSPDSELGLKNGVETMANVLSVGGVLLTIATVLLCLVNLIQSSTQAVMTRKGEIGLMKAIGYKNKQIFGCFYYEQLSLTFGGCVIGGIVSAVIIAISNFIFEHSNYVDRLYVVDWNCYLVFLAVSVLFAVIVPLICQLFTLRKLTKIQPKDAMCEN